jgi:hypothetical protein
VEDVEEVDMDTVEVVDAVAAAVEDAEEVVAVGEAVVVRATAMTVDRLTLTWVVNAFTKMQRCTPFQTRILALIELPCYTDPSPLQNQSEVILTTATSRFISRFQSFYHSIRQCVVAALTTATATVSHDPQGHMAAGGGGRMAGGTGGGCHGGCG